MKKQIGIWEIDEFGLTGKVNPNYEYYIEKNRLWDVENKYGKDVWFWLIHMTTKNWITSENIDEFNSAFFLGQNYFKEISVIQKKDFITTETLLLQKQLMDMRKKTLPSI